MQALTQPEIALVLRRLTPLERSQLDREVTEARAAAPPVSPYKWDPTGWAAASGVELWSKQREILDALREHRLVAVHSAHATGKSFCASIAVLWWIATRTPGKARAFTTAPTFPQVRQILWTEIGRTHARISAPGRTNSTELIVKLPTGGDFLAAWGRKPADHDVAAFQGIHDDEGVLVIGDEAAGLHASIISDLEKNLTGAEDRMLLIGNPDDSTSMHARICRGEIPLWHVIHVDGLESPKFTGEAVSPSVAKGLLSPEWVDGQRERYGADSPIFQSRVRGLFPEEDSQAVVSLALLAMARTPKPDPASSPRVLGVDVAAGGDWTVAQLRIGMTAGRSWRFRTKSPERTAEDLLAIVQETDADRVVIDSIGVGWGIAGALELLASRGEHHAMVVKVNVAEASDRLDPGTKKPLFPNLRSELWWRARELCEARVGEGGWDLSAVSQDAADQLAWPRWSLDPKGRIRVEAKEDTVARQGHSPDDADALNLAFFESSRAPKRRTLIYRP